MIRKRTKPDGDTRALIEAELKDAYDFDRRDPLFGPRQGRPFRAQAGAPHRAAPDGGRPVR